LFETPQQTRDRHLRQTAQARQQREAQCRIPGPVGTTPPAQACYGLLTGRAACEFGDEMPVFMRIVHLACAQFVDA
jgi:hypothetical protein